MLRRNQTVPHLNVPHEDLPHLVDTPGAGNSGPDDPFMHASLPTADDDDEGNNDNAPAPSPWLARRPTTPTSILVVDSRLESVKAPPPKLALFQKALRRQRRLRERRLAASAFPGAARVLQPVLGKWSPMDVMEAFKASGQAREEEGAGATQEEGGKVKEVRIRVASCIVIRPNASTDVPRLYFTRTTQHDSTGLSTSTRAGSSSACSAGCSPSPPPPTSARTTNVSRQSCLYQRSPRTSIHLLTRRNPLHHTALDSEWWLEPNTTTTTTGAARRAQQQASTGPRSTGTCTYSDACAGAATPQDALALAAGVSPDPLPSVPGLPALKALHKTSAAAATILPTRGDARGQRRRLAATGADTGSADYSAKLPEALLFQQKLTVHCPAESGQRCGLTERGVKGALKGYVADSEGGFPVGADPSYKLTVAYADALPEAVLEALDPEEDVGDAALLRAVAPRRLSEACPHAAAFTVFVLTRDAETGAGLRRLFAELAADAEGLLGGVVQASTTWPTAFCEAGLVETGALVLPSIDTPAGVASYQDQFVLSKPLLGGGGGGLLGSGRSLLAFGDGGPAWPTVLLLDPASVAPAGAVRTGAAYRVVLAGFEDCPGEVAVELVQGLRADGTVLATVPSASPVGAAGGGGDGEQVEVSAFRCIVCVCACAGASVVDLWLTDPHVMHRWSGRPSRANVKTVEASGSFCMPDAVRCRTSSPSPPHSSGGICDK